MAHGPFLSYMMSTAVTAFLLFGLVATAVAQDFRHLGRPGAPAAVFPEPDRPVADIISPSWRTEAERDAVDEAGQIARLLNIKPGLVVGDIGAGAGYHTVRLSPLVGPNGRIIAQDVMPDHLSALADRVRNLRLANVTIGLGKPHDPRLPPGSLDVALMANMFHEVEQPYAFVYNLIPALKPGALVGILDIDADISEHGTPPNLLRCELAAVGYRQLAFHRLKGSPAFLAIFAAPTVTERPPPASIVPCRTKAG